MATEKLKFKLKLYSDYWGAPPYIDVLINNDIQWSGHVKKRDKEDPLFIEFDYECTETEKYNMTIRRSKKVQGDTVVNEKGDILHDSLLHIQNVEIDDINIGSLIYEAVYTPDYPKSIVKQHEEAGKELPKNFNCVTTLGHNGDWTLPFESPFYMWLLKSLY